MSKPYWDCLESDPFHGVTSNVFHLNHDVPAIILCPSMTLQGGSCTLSGEPVEENDENDAVNATSGSGGSSPINSSAIPNSLTVLLCLFIFVHSQCGRKN